MVDDNEILFNIKVKKQYAASIGSNAKKGSAFIENGIIISRHDSSSDQLISYLSKQWGLQTIGKFSDKPIADMQSPLCESDVDTSKDYLHSKIFYQDATREIDCEFYIDTDLKNNIIYFSEKDPDLNEDFVRSLLH